MVLKRHIRITSTGHPLRWTASKNQSWIVVSPAGGATPTDVTVAVDSRKLPPWRPDLGAVTVSAAGASNTPQKIRVEVNNLGRPPASYPSP